MFKKIAAVVLIFFCTAVAWVILGATVLVRTKNYDKKMGRAVTQLWGSKQHQKAPSFSYKSYIDKTVRKNVGGKIVVETKKEAVQSTLPVDSSDIAVDLNIDYRRKGLLWYSTYKVDFDGNYGVKNTTRTTKKVNFNFDFPSRDAIYSDFDIKINGKKIDNVEIKSGAVSAPIYIKSGETANVQINYKSQGVEKWVYDFGYNVNKINNFNLKMTTDFDKIDFPADSISPTKKTETDKGWSLVWNYKSLLTGAKIGMVLPTKLNPGPWVSKITFFAPVSLFFFFFLIFIFTTIKKIEMHPLNYFFLGAAFFAFHLLLAYLVDHISVHLAFGIASVVSIFLVISYMRLVVGPKFAFLEVGISQLIFLVGFSYSFFFEGYAGLTVTIMSIVTLFVIMQITARVDWKKLSQKEVKKETSTLAK